MGLWRRLRQRNPGVSLPRFLWWELFWRPVLWIYLFFCYRVRAYGLRNVPEAGPTLLVCNHQSFLDLLIIGVHLPRHFHSMARKTLFNNPIFGAAITALNAFPVDQERGDTAAMKTAMQRMRDGHVVLVFPEGARSPDGEIHAFHRGIWLLIRRVKPTIVPAAIEGAHHAWARGQTLPRLAGRVGVIFGEPIDGTDLAKKRPDEAIPMLHERVCELQDQLRDRLRRRGDTARFWSSPSPAKASDPS